MRLCKNRDNWIHNSFKVATQTRHNFLGHPVNTPEAHQDTLPHCLKMCPCWIDSTEMVEKMTQFLILIFTSPIANLHTKTLMFNPKWELFEIEALEDLCSRFVFKTGKHSKHISVFLFGTPYKRTLVKKNIETCLFRGNLIHFLFDSHFQISLTFEGVCSLRAL